MATKTNGRNGEEQDGPSEEEQARRLREFLRRLESLLDAVATHPGNFIAGRHHQALREAWTEVRPRFAQINLTTKHRKQLIEVGLSGQALLFELGVFNHARDELLDAYPELFAAPDPSPPPPQPPTFWQRVRGLFRKTLKAGDVILGSIGKIPVFGMPAEAIKQYKESIEAGVEMGTHVADAVTGNVPGA